MTGGTFERLPDAIEVVRQDGRCSTSMIQRKLAIGYNAASRLVEEMERRGMVSKPNHVGKREILDLDAAAPDDTDRATATGQMRVKAPAQTEAADRSAPPVGNQNGDQEYGIAADELRQFIEQYEQLEAEKKDIAEQQKEIMTEAKARGYDTKVMRKIIAMRKRDRDDLSEEEAILEMYKTALGMA